MTLTPQRSMTGYARHVSILMAICVLSLSRIAAGDPADDEPLDEIPWQEPRFEVSDTAVYGRAFGDGADRPAGCEQLATLLRQKIAIVDRVCGLTETQKQKLQLAGLGDATRLLRRVDQLGARIQLVKDDREQTYLLLDEALSVQREFIRPGLSSDGSLFFKSLERHLTEEQLAKYAPLRQLAGAGGLVRIRRDGATDALEIRLTGLGAIDDELAHLREVPGLQFLDLSGSQVTDAGMAHLAGLTTLQTLVLNHTRVTDQGLAELKELAGLRELALDKTSITDAGLEHLEGHTNLQHLSLKDTGVGDAGLVHLKGLTRLESLDLDESEVTDSGLEHLKRLSLLQLLLVRRTTVTDSGVARLHRTSPRLAIHR